MKKIFDTFEQVEEFVQELYDEQKWAVRAGELLAGGYIVQWIEHKTYIAVDGKEFADELWVTASGELKCIQDLEPEHARNIIRMLLRTERENREASSEAEQDDDFADGYNLMDMPVAENHTVH